MSDLDQGRGEDAPHQRAKSRNFSKLVKLSRYLRPYRWLVAAALIALAVAAAATLSIGLAIRSVIDHGFGGESSRIDLYFMAFLAVIAVLAAATFARFYLVSWIGERVVADARRSVFDHVLRLSPAFFEITKTGEVLSRLTTDTTLIQTVVGSSLSVALRNILLFLGGIVLLVVNSPKLALVTLVMVPAVVVPIVYFGRKVRALSRQSQDTVAAVSAQAGETLDAIRTTQAFTHEDLDRETFSAQNETAFQTAARRIRARSWLTAAVILLVFGTVDVVLWIGASDVTAGRMTAGTLGAFVFYAIVVAGAMGSLSEVWGDLQRAAGAGERLAELLDVEPDIRAPEQPLALPDTPLGAISFEDVSFRYPASPENSALEQLSFNVASGETVALVGPSGAGKTTVFQLLLRFYDPQTGRILVDGVNIAEADPHDVRRRIGLVPQEPVIFSTNALENIRYGRPNATDEEVRKAAEAAAAADFIDALPDGFQTFLGERGVRLSGGQRQRIAIARAILRNPAILLLDEATSALDSENEQLVQRAFEHLMQDRTTLVIAHRLATVLKADRIVVIDAGRVVATGTHRELMNQTGLYARLAKLQFDAGVQATS